MNPFAEALRSVLRKDGPTPADVHVPTAMSRRRRLASALRRVWKGADPGLYVARPLTQECAERLRAWAAAQGLPPLDPNLHVTVVHSTAGIPWDPAKDTVSVPQRSLLRAKTLGADNAVVLLFRCASLQSRWKLSRRAGAAWDYASYQPHLTLYYHGPLPAELPDFPLEFGPEVAGPLAADVFAKAQQHDPHSGQFESITGYHGTNVQFDTFDQDKIGSATDEGHLGHGFYFSTDPQVGRGSRFTMERELLLRNPLQLKLTSWEEDKRNVVRQALGLRASASGKAVTAAARARGHDSVVLDYTPLGYHHREVVVFHPRSIHVRKAFDSAEHPRDSAGKFGAGGTPKSTLTPFHRKHLAEYKGADTSTNAIGLNGMLRDGHPLDFQRRVQVGQLDQAFEHHYALPGKATLYRGVTEAPVFQNGMLTDAGYTSTTSSPEVAHEYSTLMSDTGHVLEIRMPRGAKLIGMDRHAGHFDASSTIGAEHEYLLPRGSTFKHISSQGNHHVVEYVAPVAKFEADEHPRGEHGEFVHGVGVQGPLQGRKDKRPMVWLDADGKPLPAEAQAHLQQIAGKGFAAPNYSQQRYFPPTPGRTSTYVGEVTDQKGRTKRFYLDDVEQANAGAKAARVRALASVYPKFQAKLDATTGHDAMALRLISETGMRPGSDRDTRADAKAFGATNMPMSAVRVRGNTVHFSFPAKNGKTYVTSVTDPVLAKFARGRQRAGAERLFATNETKVRDLFKRLTGRPELQLKDLRTAHGTAIAQRELMAHHFRPATEGEFRQLQKQIATTVSAALQNTPKVALDRYILDSVWSGYRPGGRHIKVA